MMPYSPTVLQGALEGAFSEVLLAFGDQIVRLMSTMMMTLPTQMAMRQTKIAIMERRPNLLMVLA